MVITVRAARFEPQTADGRPLPQSTLIGTILTLGQDSTAERIRIDGVVRDPLSPDEDVQLYTLTRQNGTTGDWENICDPDPEGRRAGFPLAGEWTDDGRHLASDGFSITCTSGAQGKCVRYGYRPWLDGVDGQPMWSLHQACTRMIRADYCGTGDAHTRNGTPIVVFDHFGIQRDEAAPGMAFEAAWGADGAVCVERTRLKDVLTTGALAAACPAITQAQTCSTAAGALILNRSIAGK